MPSVRLWTPESDYDRDAVFSIARKTLKYYKDDGQIQEDIKIEYAGKEAYNTVARERDGLNKAVAIYLKRNDLVIFLIDADSEKSQAQRKTEKNSYINRITPVVNSSGGKAKLILMLQELEAWLLVDCLGICCYYKKEPEIRNNQEWIKFAKSKQPGKTDLIQEPTIGGKNAKEYLVEFSKEILVKINPNLREKPRNLKERQYTENQSPEIAEFIEINNQTIKRNPSLEEFAQCLKQLAKVE